VTVPPNATGTITHDGVTSSSNSQTSDEMRESLGITPPADTDATETFTEAPATDVAAEPVVETTPPAQAAKPVKKDPQKRIDQVVYEREEAKREAARIKAESQREIGSLREEMQRELAELKRMARPAQEQARPEPQGDPEPDPANTEKYPDGQFDRKYLKDQARWEARQEFAEQQRAYSERQQAEHRERQQFERQSNEQARIQKLSTRMQSAFHASPDLQAKLETVAMTRPMWDVVLESDAPDQLLAYMADHSEEAERIASLPPLHAFRALSRIEYQLESAAALTGSAPVKPKTAAHAPISPVSGSQSAPKSGPPDPKTCTQEEFDAYYNAEEKADRLAGRR
jgi:hypothetical protein